MLQIQKVKEIRGRVELPPNPDLFLLTLSIALAAKKSVRITPVSATPLIHQIQESFAQHLDIVHEDTCCRVSPKADAGLILMPQTGSQFDDFIVFLFLGLQKTVALKNLSPKKLALWQQRAAGFGCRIESKQFDDATTGLYLASFDAFTAPAEPLDQNTIHPCMGLALGLNKKIQGTLEQQFHTPLRHILPRFGYELTIKAAYEKRETDPLKRRLRFIAPKLAKKQESRVSYTMAADFSCARQDDVTVELPGDDTLAAILLAAKSLVQKGQLVISNAPLEPWSCAVMSYLRKMGCNEGIQEERTTSFGPAGMLCLQKFNLAGHKMECNPLYYFKKHLPAMAVIATFAEGQSVFRGISELHNETPDAAAQIVRCVERMGGRYGELPDGMVIDGAKQYDGFDIAEELPAALSGACVAAGLKCNGTTTIADAAILQRWPGFRELLESICVYKSE